MKTKKCYTYLAVAGLCLNLSHCQLNEEVTKQVDPPFKQVDVAFTCHQIISEEGDSIHLSNGSSILIPKDAFVDSAGNLYHGKLQINYREFHQASEILASGISMRYDSAGQQLSFQTAGMFEIRAQSANHQDLQIAPGKNLLVNMASHVNGSEYNFYYLDEQSGWKYRGNKNVRINEEKQKRLSEIPLPPPIPVKPAEQDRHQKVFNLTFDKNTHPELDPYSDLVWQYAGEKGDAEKDPELNSWVFSYNWGKADLGKYREQEMYFELTLQQGLTSFKTYIHPVLTGKKLEAALQEFNSRMEQYKKKKESIEQAAKQALLEADFLRSYTIQQFGIYNWDCIHRQPERMAIQASFSFDDPSIVAGKGITAYLITGSNRSLVRYEYENWNHFSFDPQQQNKLILILPGNRIALFSEEQFSHLDIDKIKADKCFQFHLHVAKTTVNNLDDLSKLINS